MAPRSVPECAKEWNPFQVAKILGRARETIQLTPTNNETDEELKYTIKLEDGKTFQAAVHKDLLCWFSTYYRAALKGGFSEATSQSLVLELNSECCYLLVSWLYTGRWAISDLRWRFLFNLYVFADKTDMLALRRSIMTVVRTWRQDIRMLPVLEHAAIALKSLPSSSPLYRWLLDLYTHHWMSYRKHPDDVLPNEFLMAWVKRAAARKCVVTTGPCADCPCCKAAICDFHEHESIEEWRSTCGAGKDSQVKQPDGSSLKNKAGHKTSPKTNETR
ncbi:hypothetical protein E4T49_05084 [Aureobasidium sp. EXF-10728]|nr:hypothetical protein E4T49_05084 [Aureobasidium sp. EXF-10728]